jgi:Leucine-rich repeat (LRR) protein
MEDIIKSQTKDQDPSEVYELILDKYRGTSISESNSILLSKFCNLESLSLNLCGLKSLENFPVLPSLMKLELSDNKLKSNLAILGTLSSLTQLSLAGNQISDFKELAPLSTLENLITLDLFGNPLTEAENYKARVFEMFSSLKVLDGCDKNGDEVSVASEDDSESSDEENDLSGLIDDNDYEAPVKRERNEEECKKVPEELNSNN